MYCTKCGAPCPENARFCIQCGHKLDRDFIERPMVDLKAEEAEEALDRAELTPDAAETAEAVDEAVAEATPEVVDPKHSVYTVEPPSDFKELGEKVRAQEAAREAREAARRAEERMERAMREVEAEVARKYHGAEAEESPSTPEMAVPEAADELAMVEESVVVEDPAVVDDPAPADETTTTKETVVAEEEPLKEEAAPSEEVALQPSDHEDTALEEEIVVPGTETKPPIKAISFDFADDEPEEDISAHNVVADEKEDSAPMTEDDTAATADDEPAPADTVDTEEAEEETLPEPEPPVSDETMVFHGLEDLSETDFEKHLAPEEEEEPADEDAEDAEDNDEEDEEEEKLSFAERRRLKKEEKARQKEEARRAKEEEKERERQEEERERKEQEKAQDPKDLQKQMKRDDLARSNRILTVLVVVAIAILLAIVIFFSSIFMASTKKPSTSQGSTDIQEPVAINAEDAQARDKAPVGSTEETEQPYEPEDVDDDKPAEAEKPVEAEKPAEPEKPADQSKKEAEKPVEPEKPVQEETAGLDVINTKISRKDLEGLSRQEVQDYMNYIYARNGFPFKEEIRVKYEKEPWYKVNNNFTDADLSPTERANRDLIVRYMKDKGWRK